MEIIYIIAVITVVMLLINIILTFKIVKLLDNNKQNAVIEDIIRKEFVISRNETENSMRQNREEQNNSLNIFADSILKRANETAVLQNRQNELSFGQMTVALNALTKSNEDYLEKMRGTIENKLYNLQQDNSRKLDQMRAVVDEKLNDTLEKRLGESFKLVSERLEMVHQGLGEMQSLAVGVGDLKKVLTNVKSRGILGEIQLGNILEQLLTPGQYAENIATKKNSSSRVEFAVKLPGKDNNEAVWLPIDAKFPLESYQKLLNAHERGNLTEVNDIGKELEQRIKSEAKDIRDKYIDPPYTTDFGIMFLPVEGLYAEVLQRDLFDILQREYKVIITGPTTLAAFLNSLQMGFRTLAIEKRSGEVWTLLGSVKTEFEKFGDILEKTSKKLQEASNSIETAGRKSRTIQRKLKDVQALPLSYAEYDDEKLSDET